MGKQLARVTQLTPFCLLDYRPIDYSGLPRFTGGREKGWQLGIDAEKEETKRVARGHGVEGVEGEGHERSVRSQAVRRPASKLPPTILYQIFKNTNTLFLFTRVDGTKPTKAPRSNFSAFLIF